MSVVDQIKTDDAINSVAQESLFTAFPELTMDEEFDDANVATGNFTPAKLNGMSARWYVDTYRSWVDEAGVDEAKKQMEETNKVISSEDTAGMFGKDNSEEFIVPKGYIQELGMRLGHAPTDAEIIAAWMYNLGAFEAGS